MSGQETTGDGTKKREPVNETMRVLLERASCRSFHGRPVPVEVQDQLFAAAIQAPTGGNLQPYSIIKIENGETNARLAEMCWQPFIGKAPMNLIFCIDWHRLRRWARSLNAPFAAHHSFRHFWISFQDTIIAAQNLCTAADALGLGTVYIGTILEYFRDLKEILGLPGGVFPVVMVTIGYPKTYPDPRPRIGADFIVHSERYRESDDDALVQAYDEKYRGARLELNEKRLAELEEAARGAHGEEFATACREKTESSGHINIAQRYFGLHYRAHGMVDGNDEFMKIFEEYGFHWFTKFAGPIPAPD